MSKGLIPGNSDKTELPIGDTWWRILQGTWLGCLHMQEKERKTKIIYGLTTQPPVTTPD